ncbi:MAG: hypothetical protein DRI73_07675 [Bacteroidetes bacterium]|nr:MAG: hypothetical protein DRI73_07675 [Bacteroidota bacterium]
MVSQNNNKFQLKRIKLILLFTFTCIVFTSCPDQKNTRNIFNPEEYKQWKAKRITYLKSHEGWLNLAGLFWLEEGENTIGSSPDNTIQFPEDAPAFTGIFILTDSIVFFEANPDITIFNKGKRVEKIQMEPDVTMHPTILSYDSLEWFIIKRGEQYGIRLRDFNRKEINKLDSIPCFPPDPKWKVKATLIIPSKKVSLMLPDVLGQATEQKVPGILEFSLKGISYQLYPLGTPNDLWVIFSDETSGDQSYGGGRFLEIAPPDKKGNYFLDFNKAYNPPCAFTEFATCPLPPKENILEIGVMAGEKGIPHEWH